MQKDPEIYNTTVGIEFEFIRNPTFTRTEIKRELQKILKVDIKLENGHHTDFVPTDNHWKIEDDFSAGEYTCELITGPLQYNHARIVLIKVLKWIRNTKDVKTTDRCGLHLNLSYPKNNYIENIDLLKFILTFDESEVYKRFPNREDNIYTKSIKDIVPLHNNFDFANITTSRSSFVYPMSKYYGINFEKIKKNYLEFRYLGGKKYEHQQSDILFLLDFFLQSIKDCYKSNPDDIKKKLIDLLEPKKKVFLAGQNYFNFSNIFKNVELKVDTKDNKEILKLFFPIIWKNIFPILIKMKEVKFNMSGVINYDTDSSKIEWSGFTIKRTFIENPAILLHDCRLINTVLLNTELYDCRVSGSDLDGCKSQDTIFKHSRIKNANYIYCEFTNCYLDDVKLLDSDINGGIFRKGTYSSTTIADNTMIIDVDVENLDEMLD